MDQRETNEAEIDFLLFSSEKFVFTLVNSHLNHLVTLKWRRRYFWFFKSPRFYSPSAIATITHFILCHHLEVSHRFIHMHSDDWVKLTQGYLQLLKGSGAAVCGVVKPVG